MKLNLACKRFRKLWNEGEVRELDREESEFIGQHRTMCDECREFEASSFSAMSFLREATLEPEISPTFDERVLRRVRVQTMRESIGYWSPALIGAGIACVAILAALQIAATPVQLGTAKLPDGEVRRSLKADQPLPDLILREKPTLDQ